MAGGLRKKKSIGDCHKSFERKNNGKSTCEVSISHDGCVPALVMGHQL